MRGGPPGPDALVGLSGAPPRDDRGRLRLPGPDPRSSRHVIRRLLGGGAVLGHPPDRDSHVSARTGPLPPDDPSLHGVRDAPRAPLRPSAPAPGVYDQHRREPRRHRRLRSLFAGLGPAGRLVRRRAPVRGPRSGGDAASLVDRPRTLGGGGPRARLGHGLRRHMGALLPAEPPEEGRQDLLSRGQRRSMASASTSRPRGGLTTSSTTRPTTGGWTRFREARRGTERRSSSGAGPATRRRMPCGTAWSRSTRSTSIPG